MAQNRRWIPSTSITAMFVVASVFCILTWFYAWFLAGLTAPTAFDGFTIGIIAAIGTSTGIFAAILATDRRFQDAYDLGISFVTISIFNVGALPLSIFKILPIVPIVGVGSFIAHGWYVYLSISAPVSGRFRRESEVTRALSQFDFLGLLNHGHCQQVKVRVISGK